MSTAVAIMMMGAAASAGSKHSYPYEPRSETVVAVVRHDAAFSKEMPGPLTVILGLPNPRCFVRAALTYNPALTVVPPVPRATATVEEVLCGKEEFQPIPGKFRLVDVDGKPGIGLVCGKYQLGVCVEFKLPVDTRLSLRPN